MNEEFPVESWKPDRLQAAADAGEIYRADSIEELAIRADIDPAALAVTIDNYNNDCDLGIDRAFLKDSSLLRPVRKGPFYAVRIKPTVIGVTGAGLTCDREARVLDQAGKPIPGLFAAGETVGGIMGSCYIGGGGSLTASFVFGRVSGRNAARRAKPTGEAVT